MNFEIIYNENEDCDVNNINLPDHTQESSNKARITISTRNRTLSQKKSSQITIYDLEELNDTLTISHSPSNDYTHFSERSSLNNAKDVIRVRRPFSSQVRKRQKLTLFQPSPQPLVLTGPIIYYQDLCKINKQLQREFDESMKHKEIKRQMKSPYKENFVRLRANSVRSTQKQLHRNEKLSRKQRWHDDNAYRLACEEEYESERHHCKIDYVSKNFHELRIIGI